MTFDPNRQAGDPTCLEKGCKKLKALGSHWCSDHGRRWRESRWHTTPIATIAEILDAATAEVEAEARKKKQ